MDGLSTMTTTTTTTVATPTTHREGSSYQSTIAPRRNFLTSRTSYSDKDGGGGPRFSVMMPSAAVNSVECFSVSRGIHDNANTSDASAGVVDVKLSVDRDRNDVQVGVHIFLLKRRE